MLLATTSWFSGMPLKLKEKKEIFQINMISLKIPTGGRQTSWLFTSMTEELKQETTPVKWSEWNLNPQPLDLKSTTQ